MKYLIHQKKAVAIYLRYTNDGDICEDFVKFIHSEP